MSVPEGADEGMVPVHGRFGVVVGPQPEGCPDGLAGDLGCCDELPR